jgi:hypothetical protein
MSFSPGWSEHEMPRSDVPVDPALREFARIEGLVGEELALLGVSEQDRTPEQHARLRTIRDELDRIFELLRERAERLSGRRQEPGGSAT